MVQNSKIKIFAPIRRYSYRDTAFLGVLKYSTLHYDRLKKFIEDFLDKAKIVNSIIKADIIISDKDINVIEMDIGVGGGSYYKKYISELFGCDIMDEYIKLITNQKVDVRCAVKETIRMDYVYNHSANPVKIDLAECKKKIESRFGECIIQKNVLSPETKGGYCSNADFLITVITSGSDKKNNMFEIDDFVNKYCLKG